MSDIEPPTVGVEEEFLLVDPDTGTPLAVNAAVARAAAELGVELQLELSRCQVEVATGVATAAGQLRTELRHLRHTVAHAARRCDALLLAVAAPLFAPENFPVTATPRYERIAAQFGMLAREPGICGCHVHVGVPDRETAVRVSNWLRVWLPTLLATTANSAVYRGVLTGYASWRCILWRRWPSAGPPPHFASEAHYDATVAMMRAAGTILDDAMVYWDVRPSSRFPTVEIRVSDVPATVEETVLVATLIRAAVAMAIREIRAERFGPPIEADMLRAAYWKAAHDGLAGDHLDVRSGTIRPARAQLELLLDYLAPALDTFGDTGWVAESVAAVLKRGNGAMRQTAAFGRNGNVGDVLAECAAATLAFD